MNTHPGVLNVMELSFLDFNFKLTQWFYAGTSVEDVDCRLNLKWCQEKCDGHASGTFVQVIPAGTKINNYLCRQVTNNCIQFKS